MKQVAERMKSWYMHQFTTVFTARRYASAVYAMALCPSVCLCLSQVGVLLKRLKAGSRKENHTIAQGL